MNGMHDMGGRHCHGAIDPETDEPLFHHDWESRVLALTLACGATGSWNLDESRHSRECLPPEYYLSAGYYKIWLAALEQMLLRKGLLSQQELVAGKVTEPAKTVTRVLQAADVVSALQNGAPVEREAQSPAQFQVSDVVRVRNHQPASHTRLPAYIRNRVGRIAEVHGCHIYPDSHASAQQEDPRWLYSVEFLASELWGDADASGSVMVDCWEPYLEPAGD